MGVGVYFFVRSHVGYSVIVDLWYNMNKFSKSVESFVFVARLGMLHFYGRQSSSAVQPTSLVPPASGCLWPEKWHHLASHSHEVVNFLLF
jgi:hypothetical protein